MKGEYDNWIIAHSKAVFVKNKEASGWEQLPLHVLLTLKRCPETVTVFCFDDVDIK